MSRILAIDYGETRVGLAVSDETGTLASGYGYLEFAGYRDLVEQIAKAGEKECVGSYVIGLPLNMNGSRGRGVKKVEKIAGLLSERTGKPVDFVDERLTTVEAARQLHASGKKARKGRIDEVAATIILQAYLNGQKRE